MAVIGLTISLICAIPVVLFIWDKFRRKGYDMDFTLENTIIVPAVSSNQNVNNKTAICFYQMTIVNKNLFSTTIKNVEVSAKIGKSWYKTTPHRIKTGKLKDATDVAVLSNGQTSIFIQGWKNLHAEIHRQNALSDGGVLRGSAVFILETDIDKAKHISKLKILISDYLKKRSVKYVKTQDKWLNDAKKNFRIVDKELVQIDDKTFQWRNE